MYGIDNVSHIQPWLSDALAALVTGESDKRRNLYTDAEPFRLDLKAAVVMTGITIEGAGPDLLERTVPVSLETIRRGDRLSEAKLWVELERQLPAFLGALFDLVPPVLAALVSDRAPEDLPRMADFATVLGALDGVIERPAGASSFYDYYTTEMPQFTADEVIESSEFAGDLVKWWTDRARRPWAGTATDLLQEVAVKRFDSSAGGTPKIPKSSGYPRTARGVTAALKRLAPVLRTVGIVWTPPKPGGSHNARTHTISPSTSAETLETAELSRAVKGSETAPTAPSAGMASPVRKEAGRFVEPDRNSPLWSANGPDRKALVDTGGNAPGDREAFGAVPLPQTQTAGEPADVDEPETIEQDEIERLAALALTYQERDRVQAQDHDSPSH